MRNMGRQLNKEELRTACKEKGIKNYGKMNNDQMREALKSVPIPSSLGGIINQIQNSNSCEREGDPVTMPSRSNKSINQENKMSKTSEEMKIEKEAEKAAKKEIKEAEKQAKQAEKEAEKAAKNAERQAAKELKEAEKAAKKAASLYRNNGYRDKTTGKEGTIGKIVWDFFNNFVKKQMVAGKNTVILPGVKECKELAEANGWKYITVYTELHDWKRFCGFNPKYTRLPIFADLKFVEVK